jgi:hypothetical protein
MRITSVAAFSHSQGHERLSGLLKTLSALPFRADLDGLSAIGRFVPIPDILPGSTVKRHVAPLTSGSRHCAAAALMKPSTCQSRQEACCAADKRHQVVSGLVYRG